MSLPFFFMVIHERNFIIDAFVWIGCIITNTQMLVSGVRFQVSEERKTKNTLFTQASQLFFDLKVLSIHTDLSCHCFF